MRGYIEINTEVVYPVRLMEEGGRIRTSDVATCLLTHLKNRGAYEDTGYITAVTELRNMDRGTRASPEHIVFNVTARARSFKPESGDVMIGTVHEMRTHGVFLKCGPMKTIYIPNRFMGDYSYVEAEEPFFLSGDQDRIEMDTVIRFKVVAARWKPRLFDVVATINEPSLGPIQSAGDGEDMESIDADD